MGASPEQASPCIRATPKVMTTPVRRIPAMKKSYLLSLSLAAALAIPAAAQNSNSSSDQQQPPANQVQSQQTPQAQPADQQAATGKEPLKYERHEGFWG